MSQVIELPDEVFTKLKENADKDGVTPEVWIEVKVEENSSLRDDKPKFGISDQERKELDEFHKRMEKTFDEIMKDKARKEGLKTW
jgi:hypothetical protein